MTKLHPKPWNTDRFFYLNPSFRSIEPEFDELPNIEQLVKEAKNAVPLADY